MKYMISLTDVEYRYTREEPGYRLPT